MLMHNLTVFIYSQEESSEMFIGEWAEACGIRDQLFIATISKRAVLDYARSRLRSFELFSYRSFLFVTFAIPFSPFLLIIYIPYLMCELLLVAFIALD